MSEASHTAVECKQDKGKIREKSNGRYICSIVIVYKDICSTDGAPAPPTRSPPSVAAALVAVKAIRRQMSEVAMGAVRIVRMQRRSYCVATSIKVSSCI
ncbi:hypothetical protein EYF80_055141 [Liparis tanakae]|uniref:Uncharacterized protein n=1 Tax=Liparis tanakae TaxID=230148 RepID=A0A4Z2F2H6_9TELE|nr:hypothetical protein EYF80_055141 [Liparis tanakae]